MPKPNVTPATTTSRSTNRHSPLLLVRLKELDAEFQRQTKLLAQASKRISQKLVDKL